MSDHSADVQQVAACQIGLNPAIYVGKNIGFDQMTPSFGAVSRQTRVSNWDLFDGMMLAVTFTDGREHKMEGTATLVAPGIALCAKHVFDAHLPEITAKSGGKEIKEYNCAY